MHGVVRLIFKNNDIIEAVYQKDGASGFGRKLYANGEVLNIKGVNWFGSEGRSGPPLGLDKHTSARTNLKMPDRPFFSLKQWCESFL